MTADSIDSLKVAQIGTKHGQATVEYGEDDGLLNKA